MSFRPPCPGLGSDHSFRDRCARAWAQQPQPVDITQEEFDKWYKKTNHYYKVVRSGDVSSAARPCTDCPPLTSQKLAKLDIAKPRKDAVAAQPTGAPPSQLESTARVDTPSTDGASTAHGNTAPRSGE